MNEQDQLEEGTLGVLFPDEFVEKFGLREGDAFTVVEVQDGITLMPQSPELAERMRSTPDKEAYRLKVQDLTK